MPGDRNYEVKGPIEERFDEILTSDALGFVADLHRRFNATRKELLNYTLVVIAFVVIMMLIVTVLDLAFGQGSLYIFGDGAPER